MDLSGPSAFSFEDQARLVALHLCDSKPKLQPFEEGDPTLEFADQEELLNKPEKFFASDPPNRNAGDLQLLRRAVHLGGSEFMAKVLDECDRLVAPQRSDLPAPIDPDKLG